MVFGNELSLPPHIAFARRLAPFVHYNLSDSCAETLTLLELLALGNGTPEHLDLSSLDEALSPLKIALSPLDVPLCYASLQGDPVLRAEIAAFHSELNLAELNHSPAVQAGHVITFSGAQEALRAVYQAVLSPGDEVIVMTPCYPSLAAMAPWFGATTHSITLRYENGWQPELEKLAALFTAKTRLVVINSPHNPTGAVLDAQARRQLLELARHHGCYLLADDVSQAINPFGRDLAHGYYGYEKSVLVSVMSKSVGLGGIRIGWTVTPDEALGEKLLAVKAQGSICTSVVDERLALLALKARAQILERNNRIVAGNIALFEQFLADQPEIFSWRPPGAGLLALVAVNCREGIEDWCLSTAKKTGVGLMPASLFGLEGKFVRLGLGRRDFAEGLKQLALVY